jgi:hypothetical protein
MTARVVRAKKVVTFDMMITLLSLSSTIPKGSREDASIVLSDVAVPRGAT